MMRNQLNAKHHLIMSIHKWANNLATNIGETHYVFHFKNKNKNSYTLKYCFCPKSNSYNECVQVLTELTMLKKQFEHKILNNILQKYIKIKMNKTCGLGSGKGEIGNVRLVISNNILNNSNIVIHLISIGFKTNDCLPFKKKEELYY